MPDNDLSWVHRKTPQQRWEDQKAKGHKAFTLKMPRGDDEMLEDIRECLGTRSKGEAARTAIRVYHALLVQGGVIKRGKKASHVTREENTHNEIHTERDDLGGADEHSRRDRDGNLGEGSS